MGKSSLYIFAEYVQQKRGKDFPVTIVYEDLPENDFTVILTNVDGLHFNL